MRDAYSAHDPWTAFEAGKFTLAANIWQQLADLSQHRSAPSGCPIAQALALTMLGRHEEALSLIEGLYEAQGQALYLHYLGLLEFAAGEQKRTWRHLQASGCLPLSDAEARQLAQLALQLAGMTWKRREQARYFAQAAQQYALLGEDQLRAEQATSFLERLRLRETGLSEAGKIAS